MSVAFSSELSTASSVASRTASNRSDTAVGRQNLSRLRGAGAGHPQGRMGRKCDREIAAAVRVGRTGARERVDGARGETSKIARVERRVGRDDDHAGAVGGDLPSGRSPAGAFAFRRAASFQTGTPRSSGGRHSSSARARPPSTCRSCRRTRRDDVPMPPFQPKRSCRCRRRPRLRRPARRSRASIAAATCSRVT